MLDGLHVKDVLFFRVWERCSRLPWLSGTAKRNGVGTITFPGTIILVLPIDSINQHGGQIWK